MGKSEERIEEGGQTTPEAATCHLGLERGNWNIGNQRLNKSK
jgi:hypothetical protein